MKRIPLSIVFLCLASWLGAQKLEVKEVWASGYARSVLYADEYFNDSASDSTTAAKLMSGHTLVDLGINIKPSDKVFVQGMLRVRNDHGGFWGSGVTFDVRNLYLRGLIGNSFRYQLGDINYKLTPYTLFNSDEELSRYEPKVFQLMREMTRYDLFYNDDNSWRQQGATGEFGLTFKKYVDGVDFSFFTSRLNSAASTGLLDRLHSGGSVFVKQSDLLDFRLTYIDAFDILGTSSATNRYSNPVLTGGIGIHKQIQDWRLDLETEFGTSQEEKKVGESSAERQDYFSDIRFKMRYAPYNLSLSVAYQDVGAGFRSIGAQTKRLNFSNVPLAYQRIGDGQNLRPFGMLDIIRDASLYNTALSTSLMSYDPAYGNFRPYGASTPNRRNLILSANWEDKKGMAEIQVTGISGSEIQGQGTESIKQFNVVDAGMMIHMDKILDMKKEWLFNFGYSSEKTQRFGEADYEDIDLSNQVLSAGMEVEFIKDFQFLAGYRLMVSKGNEYLARKDLVGEVITFTPYEVDMQQDMFALGVRYNFSERSLINFQWTNYSYQDQLNLNDDHRLTDLSLIYRMNF
jgi:hypothetical protein